MSFQNPLIFVKLKHKIKRKKKVKNKTNPKILHGKSKLLSSHFESCQVLPKEIDFQAHSVCFFKFVFKALP